MLRKRDCRLIRPTDKIGSHLQLAIAFQAPRCHAGGAAA